MIIASASRADGFDRQAASLKLTLDTFTVRITARFSHLRNGTVTRKLITFVLEQTEYIRGVFGRRLEYFSGCPSLEEITLLSANVKEGLGFE